jgi:hypothetical protein
MSSSPAPAHPKKGGLPGIPTLRNVGLSVGVALLLFGLLFIWHPWTSWGLGSSSPGGSTTYSTSATAQCPGVIQSVSLNTTSALRVNPGHICNIYFRVDRGTALLAGPAGSFEFGPAGKVVDAPFETAQAARGTAEMRYVLCSGKKRNLDTWDCQ